MKLSIDQFNRFSSKPLDSEPASTFASINNNVVVGWNDYSLEQIVEYITNGHTFSTSKYKARRKALDWQGQQCFGIDIDKLTSPGPTRAIAIINEVLDVDPIITYNTFSSNNDNNKYRIIIAADEVVTEPKLALAVLRGLVDKLRADSACLDLARIFYGTTPNKLIQSSNSTISVDKLRAFADDYESAKQEEEPETSNVRHGVISVSGLTAKQKKLLLLHIEKHWSNALRSDKYSRYETLRRVIIGARGTSGFPMMKLDFMSVELAVSVLMDIICSSEDLTSKYITDYDKNTQTIARKLAVWADSQFGDNLISMN